MFGRYWGVDTPENWRSGLARAGSMWEERQVVKGGGSVLNGSGVQFRNLTWKNTASGSFSVAPWGGKDCQNFVARIGLRCLNGKQYG